MRQTIFCFLLQSIYLVTYAQNKLPFDTTTQKVLFKEIIQLDTNIKADKIIAIAQDWFVSNPSNFNRTNKSSISAGEVIFGMPRANSNNVDILFKNDQPLKLTDTIRKKLLGKGVLKFWGNTAGHLRLAYFEYDIEILAKKGKLKIEISNFNYTHYNQVNMQQVQIWGWKDKGPCSSKNTLEELMKCEYCEEEQQKLYKFLNEDMKRLQEDLKQYLIVNLKKQSEDGW
jgi:hypothetical protein